MAELAMAGAAVGASKLGQMAAGTDSSSSNPGYSTPPFVTQMNNLLQNAQTSAVNSINTGTQSAIGQQNSSLSSATQQLQQYLQAASQAATQSINQGFAQSQALQSPQATAGYNALDAYTQSLGLPNTGLSAQDSAQLAGIQGQYTNAQNQLSGLKPVDPNLATTAQRAQQQLVRDSGGIGNTTNPYDLSYTYANLLRGGNSPQAAQQIMTDVNNWKSAYDAQNQAQQQYSTQQQQYQQQVQQLQGQLTKSLPNESSSDLINNLNLITGTNTSANANPNDPGSLDVALRNQYGNDLSGAPAQIQQLYNAWKQQYNTQNPISGSTAAPGTTSQGLTNFLNSPDYQLLYGTNDTSTDPTQRFQQDPGYQFAIDQGMKQLQRNSAAQGLLESGGLQQQLLSYAQGTQNQQYQNYLTQQQGLFTNYQNNLGTAAAQGAQYTGAAQANSNAQLLANLLSSYQMGTGSTLFGGDLTTGQNISGLYANQGNSEAGIALNTASAQANNIFQGNQFQAQVTANQNANQNAAASNQASAQGYSNGAGMFGSSASGGGSTYYGAGGIPNSGYTTYY